LFCQFLACDSLDNVIKINISNNNEKFSIPTSVSQLAKLEVLEISHSDGLSGTIPSQLSLLTSLRELRLHDNTNLIGTIPSNLGLLGALTTLILSLNSLSGTLPSQLGPKIQILHAYGNNLTGTIPATYSLFFK